jgi:hypothetical protein
MPHGTRSKKLRISRRNSFKYLNDTGVAESRHPIRTLPLNTSIQLADDAVTCFFPMYEMARMRAATAPRHLDLPKIAPSNAPRNGLKNPPSDARDSPLRWSNAFVHARQLLSANKSRVVTPNNDTLYTTAWVDLRQGPQIIDVPDTDGRYFVLGLLDMYTNPFASVGTRTTGTHKQSFLLTPPGWSGEIPVAWQAPGAHIACNTNWLWIIGRILIDGEHELGTVHTLQDGFTLRGLNGDGPQQFDRAFAPEYLGQVRPSAQHFLQVVNAALAEDPPPPELQNDLARFAAVGFGHGAKAPVQMPDAALHTLIDEALARCIARWREADTGQRSPSGWQSMPLLGPSFGNDYERRAIVAVKYIGALESRDAYYPMAFHDANGHALNGGSDYCLQFEAGALPPVDAFWSITLYNSADRMLAPNAINRYAIGDRTAGLQWGYDGSLTLHISQHEPSDPQARANWLPSPPGDFYLCLRAYVPQPAMLDGSYVLPAVVRNAS